jgi:hypothetical protein
VTPWARRSSRSPRTSATDPVSGLRPAAPAAPSLAGPAADEPQGPGVAAGLLGGPFHHGDRLVDVAQVGTAGADPAVGDAAGAAQRRGGTAAQQHRRVRALQRLGLHPGRGNLVEVAVELDQVVGPQRPQHPQELLAPGAALRVRHARGRELHPGPADAEPHVEAAAGDDVEGGQLLGHQGRREERHVEHRHPQPDAAGVAGQVGEGDDRVQDAAVDLHARARVRLPVGRHQQPLERPGRPVAELLGPTHEPDLVAGRGPRAGDRHPEPEEHRRHARMLPR